MPEPGWGLRDHLRAAAIGLVLLAQALDATPLPELRESHLRNPVAWDEIERWSGLLTDAGLPTSPEELLQFGLGLGEGSRAFRKHLLRPWWPFRRLTGTGQSWGLFAYPDPYAGRLTVNGRAAGGEWFELYRAPTGRGDRLEAQLEYRRVRGVYDDAGDRPKPRKVQSRLNAWIAAEVFAHDPELDEVEIYFERARVVRPDRRKRPPEVEERAREVFHRSPPAGATP